MDEFDDFDWLTPVLDSDYLSRHEIAKALPHEQESRERKAG